MPPLRSPANAAPSGDEKRSSGPRNWLSLLACVLLLAALWLIVLPWIGGRPSVEARIRREQARGIDPSARFYSELEMIEPVIRRMQTLQRNRPQLLWVPGPPASGSGNVRPSSSGQID